MKAGGEEWSLFQRGVEALERNADANERIVALAEEETDVEFEAAPPHCPYCGTINPDTRFARDQSQAHGPMVEIVLPLSCGNCNKTFYAISEAWLAFQDVSEVQAYFKEKVGK